ncbi:hypothetical protein Goshw_013947 [Gossypium schwendimanii]|uniref:CCHC-type domain-containing protein n=1 Tax=Gossypium schwendimanii TaxID=34291 RepID=A0A7J9N5M5_GOSSC|nr:hypothetical protein [Gossypium schwendimanii]
MMRMKRSWSNLAFRTLRGISISDLGEKRFLFRFYIEMDIERVIQGNPWTFINHLLVFHRLEKGEDPLQVSLSFVDFWALAFGLKKILWVRVRVDVRIPLKHKKRTALSPHQYFYARFQYKRLTLFCFICGNLGHGKSFCPIWLTLGAKESTEDHPMLVMGEKKRAGYIPQFVVSMTSNSRQAIHSFYAVGSAV